MKKITMVYGMDWEGVYVDGKLAIQDHMLGAVDVLRALGVKFEECECDADWLDKRGQLPERLRDVKKG